MITFTFDSVTPNGVAQIDSESGLTSQICTIVTKLSGIVKGNTLIQDTVTFSVASTMSITDAWISIRDTQAPAWVAANYAASV